MPLFDYPDLAGVVFTRNTDTAISREGWLLDGSSVNTLRGDDVVIGSISSGGYLYAAPGVVPEGLDPRFPVDFFFAGVSVVNGSTLYTDQGDDSILGTSQLGGGIMLPGAQAGFGVFLDGLLDTGKGNDYVRGISSSSLGIPIRYQEASLSRDVIQGIFSTGVFLSSQTRAFFGTGNDELEGMATGSGSLIGICFNTPPLLGVNQIGQYPGDYAQVDMGSGNDRILGSASLSSDQVLIGPYLGYAIGILISRYLENGEQVEDRAAVQYPETPDIETGAGHDLIIGEAVGASYSQLIGGNLAGIYNDGGLISTGAGQDVIIGVASAGGAIAQGAIAQGEVVDYQNCGILNNGTINTGQNADIVDALEGGFGGYGTISLGPSNDMLKGYGSGYFYGENGDDIIVFGEGVYGITQIAAQVFQITKGVQSGEPLAANGNPGMIVSSFERIGGTDLSYSAFTSGIFTVESNGHGSYENYA